MPHKSPWEDKDNIFKKPQGFAGEGRHRLQCTALCNVLVLFQIHPFLT